MNPDRHLKSHYDYFLDLVRGDDDKAEPTATSTTSTTPCSTCRPSTTSTRSRPCSRTSRSSTAPGRSTASWCGRRTSRRRALLTIEGELDDISGAGQTQAAHDLCTGIPPTRRFHYDVARRRPLRHLLGPALAREGLSRRCATSSPRTRAGRGAAKTRAGARQAAGRQRLRRRDGSGVLVEAVLDAAAADAVHALRLRRLPRLRRGDRRAATPRSTAARPAAPKASRAWRGLTGRPAAGRSIPSCGSEGAARARRHRRGRCIGCALCLKACPVDAHRRRGQAHAHRHRRALHRLRAVRAGLPGRLHRAWSRRAASAPAGTRGASARR